MDTTVSIYYTMTLIQLRIHQTVLMNFYCHNVNIFANRFRNSAYIYRYENKFSLSRLFPKLAPYAKMNDPSAASHKLFQAGKNLAHPPPGEEIVISGNSIKRVPFFPSKCVQKQQNFLSAF